MFRKLLIANRGEIACRVIRTAREMGVSTVAVYSDADSGALHVEMADEAVHLGGSVAAESYLNADRIIAAARETGAEAIHPGYGFLSENPDFVEAVAAARLIFVGPPADAIRAMGLKDSAKRLMEAAGVPVVPGLHDGALSEAELAQRAAEIGYPVLIKAVAGGGGKGMRRVDTPDRFADAIASARAEAEAAFGNGAVLVEKWITTPRHIEMQVFADAHGGAVHLFERDCSLQRRHQKVIEEAPAPGMTPEMREAMGAAAVRAAQAIGYVGAGTVEFIVDGSEGLRPDRFWFMEMNTRLQVEHPVTEAVTGLDLVAWQLRIAAGEPLPLTQDQIRLDGHAFEARVYAEDAGAGFLPATGRIAHLKPPEGARFDSGVRAGDAITPWYDPMIAKIVTHGPTRAVALARLGQALRATEIAGTVTNLGFLEALARHPELATGKVDTGLIDRDWPGLVASGPPERSVVIRAALAAAGLDAALPAFAGVTLWAPLQRRVVLLLDEDHFELSVALHAGGRVDVAMGEETVICRRRGGDWLIGERRSPGPARCLGRTVVVFAGHPWVFGCPDPLVPPGTDGPPVGIIEAPMPGQVRQILVQPGQAVAAGTRMAVLEAMKMEHVLQAPQAGRVAEVLVEVGAQVEAHAALIRLEDPAESAPPE